LKPYRLDKTAFKKQSIKEADRTVKYWRAQPPEERLRAANYLILSAYGLLDTGFPPMDKSAFSKRKND
jgi:hypothetical protein